MLLGDLHIVKWMLEVARMYDEGNVLTNLETFNIYSNE